MDKDKLASLFEEAYLTATEYLDSGEPEGADEVDAAFKALGVAIGLDGNCVSVSLANLFD